MKNIKSLGAILGATAILTLGVSSAEASQLRLLSSWDPNFPMNEHFVSVFMDRVAERSDGGLTISMDGPEVVHPFSQFEPVQTGLYQMLFSHPAYHTGETLLALTLEANTQADPARIRESGLFDAVDAEYNQLGLKLIGITTSGVGSYQFLMRDRPHDGDAPFNGMRVRGSQPYGPVIESLGGALTVLQPGEIYSSIDRGVVQGAGWPVIGTESSRLTEVTNYFTTPGFGAGHYMMFMNLDSFNALSAEHQELIMTVAAEVELDSYQVFLELTQAEIASMEEAGLQAFPLPENLAENMGAAFATGLQAIATSRGEAAAQRIIDFMTENDML